MAAALRRVPLVIRLRMYPSVRLSRLRCERIAPAVVDFSLIGFVFLGEQTPIISELNLTLDIDPSKHSLNRTILAAMTPHCPHLTQIFSSNSSYVFFPIPVTLLTISSFVKKGRFFSRSVTDAALIPSSIDSSCAVAVFRFTSPP